MFPVTITMDRYDGTYSRGSWLAWNENPDAVPEGPEEDDPECARWWRDYDKEGGLVGKGDTPDEALKDLKKKGHAIWQNKRDKEKQEDSIK